MSESVAVRLAEHLSKVHEKLDRIEEERAAFKELLDACPLPMFLCDAQTGAVVHVNQAYLDMLGVTFDELMQDGWQKYTAPERRETAMQEWLDLVCKAVKRRSSPTAYIRKNGERITRRLEFRRIMDRWYAGFVLND